MCHGVQLAFSPSPEKYVPMNVTMLEVLLHLLTTLPLHPCTLSRPAFATRVWKETD